MKKLKARKLSRRSFLKSATLVAGGTALASAAGCASVDTSGEESSPEAEVPAGKVEVKKYYNYCRGNCGGSCPLEATVADGKIVRTKPVSFEGEAQVYQQGCIKGHTNPLRLYATNRILHPMKQTGERGSDNWEEISWDEATTIIAEKFKKAQAEYGPASIGFWQGSGNTANLLGGFDGYQFDNNNRAPSTGIAQERFLAKSGATIWSACHDIAQLYFQGTVLQAPYNSVEDFLNTKLFLVWGANPTDARRSQWTYMIKAKDAGAKIITIDPQFTNTAAHSDKWVPVRGGTDGALMLAMANYIVDHDMIDEKYLSTKSVAPFLIKDDMSYVRLSDLDLEPDKSKGADGNVTETDSPVVWDEDTESFVSHLAATKPAYTGITEAKGIQVQTVFDATMEEIKDFTVEYAAEECGIPVDDVVELAELYGTVKPCYIINSWGLEHYYNSWRLYYDLAFLASLTGNAQISGAGYQAGFSDFACSHWASPATINREDLFIEDAQSCKVISSERFVEIVESGKWAGEDFPVRVVYIAGANPVHSCCGGGYIRDAFDKVDFVCVADTWMTDSARYADLVLPVAASWENEDFNGGWMTQKAVEPAGECRPDIDILRDVASKMGYDDLYTKTNEEYLRTLLDTPENIEAGTAYDDYKAQGIIWKNFTPSDGNVVPEYNQYQRTQFYLEVVPPRDIYGQTFGRHDHMPFYEHAYEAYPGSPVAEKYPLFGISYHDNYQAQSLFAHNAWLDEFRSYEGEPFMRLHTQAAEERGIKTGDTVRVFNDHGSVTLKAIVTEGIRPDTVFLPHGWQGDEFIDGHPQFLQVPCPDPVTSNNNCNDYLVEVQKA